MKLNAFCTQVEGRVACTSQATKEDSVFKLLKRLGNLVYVTVLVLLTMFTLRVSFIIDELQMWRKFSE